MSKNPETLILLVDNNFPEYTDIIPREVMSKRPDSGSCQSIDATVRYRLYYSTGWRRVRVIFIRKAERSGHSKFKLYRHISLTSFLIKKLEGLVSLRFRDTLSNDLLRKSQDDGYMN